MRIPLNSGAYQAKSIIANAQNCVNLYQEINQKDAPVPITHYLTPGLDLQVPGPSASTVRCVYRTSKGELYAVIGGNIYFVNASFSLTIIGTIDIGTTQVSMADNGLAIVVVDGSEKGYAIDIVTRNFGRITDPSFYGADKADYLDTFFIFNRPGTNQFYVSLSNATFDMLTGPQGVTNGIIDNPGSSYADGTYLAVPFLGGSGTGSSSDITISGGVVTDVMNIVAGQDYIIGDDLTIDAANVGGSGSGFVFQVTEVSGTSFDPLDIAAKTSYPDPIQTLIVMNRQIWLIGQLTSEIWYNSGAVDFPFQETPGVFIEHGCIAKYSLAKQDLSIYWLSQDMQGQIIVMRGNAYIASRISTYAIENEFSSYSVITDAIGFTYQQEGHTFYFLTFPTANKTWVYDQSAELWHERAWTDGEGNLNRHRANCGTNAYGKNIVGDWENGNLYAFNLNTYTDNGQPISRIRSFPHVENGGDRISYQSFTADMAVGNSINQFSDDPPVVSLRWSDDRGASYGNRIEQSLGGAGQYLTSIQWNRLGLARDRVFELSWSAPCNTALNGAWIETQKGSS